MSKNAYAESGVDVEAGYESVELIKKHIKKTNNLGVMNGIGSFGALFDLSQYKYQNPVLVSGTDGVGTKVELAKEMNCFDTIGIDLVAMCVNDIVAMQAKPLFFLDYIAVDQNIPTRIESIVKGICTGLQECDCALIGGETAEMPGVYQENGFDLAGFCVGVIEKNELEIGIKVKPNQVLIGIPASGIHANGYSLVRKIIKDQRLDLNNIYPELDDNMTLGEVLLRPTRIYVNDILSLKDKVDIKGIAHITGGGFYENIKRTTAQYGALIEEKLLKELSIFNFLERKGHLNKKEMYGYFNMGIGMVVIVDKEDINKVMDTIKDSYVIGKVTEDSEIKVW
ncbi:MAG: phosphoribosylformylglycinamidine cyclo-ligase [Bacilli bacterium]|jgi:phosphoribosylformylglycinamidine cyclo-ligase|nr:phosphoribosylformylglycinamidine cyclo-ligase [Bacilli bacterium]